MPNSHHFPATETQARELTRLGDDAEKLAERRHNSIFPGF